MNPNVSEATTRRKPAPWKRVTGRPSNSSPPEGGMVSGPRRWLDTVLQAFALSSVPFPPATPADRTADAPAAASVDSRELSSWRPFSPRF